DDFVPDQWVEPLHAFPVPIGAVIRADGLVVRNLQHRRLRAAGEQDDQEEKSQAVDYASDMRIGVDLGGTKIEAIALDAAGREIFRKRVPTPRGEYEGTVRAIAGLVGDAGQGSVGIGIPGAMSGDVVKNANSTWLIGRPFKRDLEKAIGREVR